MALFTPPPPKFVPPMPVVAPYVSDADTRKKLWELDMMHHRRNLEGVTGSTDQSDPGARDALVRKARERARDFQRSEMRRDIVDGNKQLVSRLKEIVKKPSAVSPPTVPHPNARFAMLSRDRQLRQKSIQNENKFLVRRILSVKSSLDISGLEKDYSRHRKDVSRLQQIPLPKLHSEKAKPRLPRVEEELPARTPSAGSFRPVRSLPLPMPKSSSMPQLAPLQAEEKPTDKPTDKPRKKRLVKRELPTSSPQAKAKPQAGQVPQPASSLHRLSRENQERAVAEFIVEEMTTDAYEALPGAEARSVMNDSLSTWPSRPSRTADESQAFDVPGYLRGLFKLCVRLAEDFESHEKVIDSAEITRSSWMRSQEMAAAEFLVDEMTQEALEVLENAEARSLMNDTHATWSSLTTGAWWQTGL